MQAYVLHIVCQYTVTEPPTGKENHRMRSIYILLGVLALVAVVAIAYLALGQGADSVPVPRSGEVITDEVTIGERVLAYSQPPYRDDYGNARVAGYIDNFGDRTIITAEVSIELRDSDGNRQETVALTVNDIPPGQRKWYDVDAGTFTGPRVPQITVVSIEVAR